jgi:fermentation-respiration switch protein FrsA (DUF1100 family)
MVKTALAILLLFEVGLPLLLLLLKDRILFLPDPVPHPRDAVSFAGPGVVARAVEVAREDGSLRAGLEVRPAGMAADATEGPVILFFHGNASNAGLHAPVLGVLVRGTGMRVLAAGYSGYGGNDGSPSEEAVVEDGLAAYDHLRGRGFPDRRIVLYGESIGGAVAAAVASRRPCGGVVAQSTFTSLSSMALRVYPVLPLTALLVRGSFRSADRLAAAGCPVLVVHGERDEVIPFAEGRTLHRLLAPRADFLPIPGARHNDLLDVAGEGYLRELKARIAGWTE